MQEYEFSEQLMCQCMFFGTDIAGIFVTILIAGLVIGIFRKLKKNQ